MEYNKIISVTGLQGLFELVTSKADGAVVRSLDDNTIKFISSRVHNFSQLEGIEVFSTKEDTKLTTLFTLMKNSEEKMPDAKADGKVLKSYFEKVYADLDFERVYASDMKKMIKWYEILTAHNIDFSSKETIEEADTGASDKPKPAKSAKIETSHAKEGKPTKSAPRKIESRGVK